MEFTGSLLSVYRNFYTQTGNVGFGLNCTVDNTTGQYLFGLSGAAGNVQFTLESGRVYYGSQFIHTYQADEPFTIEGQFATGSLNVIKDGGALIYGKPKPTGNLDYFYFSRANASLGADFDLYVSGDNAALRTITTQGYLLTTGQEGVTGYYVNDGGYPIRVFDSSILASQNYTFGKLQGNVAASNTGYFSYTGDFDSIDLTQPILTTFNTNYGDESILFYITDATTLGKYVYITGPTDFTFNSSDVLNRDLTYLNYSGGFVSSDFNTSLTFEFRHLTGQQTFTGVWNLFTGNNVNSLVSLYSAGTYSTGLISGVGTFPPNSGINFQVVYSGVSGNQAQLVISGTDVLNPINQTINFNAGA